MFFIFSGGLDISLIVGALCVLLYWYLTNNFDYWKKRNVAFDKPYPFIGTIHLQINFQQHFVLNLQKIYKRFPTEDLVGGFLSKQPVLLVRNPDLIKQIFVKDFNYFVDRGFNISTEREPLLQHLFVANGETWRVLRHKLTPTFTSGKMRKAFPVLVECGKEFKNYLRHIAEEDQEPEIRELSAKFTTDVIGTYAFGMQMNAMKDENSPFRIMGKKIFEPSIRSVLVITLNRLSPALYNILGLRITRKDIEDFFIGLFKSVVQSRDNKPSSRHDFVDLLIELKSKGYVESDKPRKDEAEGNELSTIKMTDEILAAQAFIFFAAGFETSSTTMSFALYELAKNASVQQKLINEIDQILLKYNGDITYESLKEMKYLQMVIDETLRKYPPVGALNRVCTMPYTFPDSKISLNKDVLINIPVYALHHDPKYYPEPERFIPERFLPEEVAKRHPFVYLPFGDGPRVCIGLRFAKVQSMIGLISILENYTIVPSSKTVPEIQFSKNGIILSSDKGIYLKIKSRNATI